VFGFRHLWLAPSLCYNSSYSPNSLRCRSPLSGHVRENALGATTTHLLEPMDGNGTLSNSVIRHSIGGFW
jgi:hypothetical protein